MSAMCEEIRPYTPNRKRKYIAPRSAAYYKKKNVEIQSRVTNLNRKWMTLKVQNYGVNPTNSFSVMTYNILSHKLADRHSYLYRCCNSNYVSWKYRRDNLALEILTYKSDIVCLQEVDCNEYENFFKDIMNKAGYIGFYKQRTGVEEDGLALFVKDSEYKVLLNQSVEYKMPELCETLNRDNVGLIVVLEHKSTKVRMCVATTHLLFNPNQGIIKFAQYQALTLTIREILRNNKDYDVNIPIIITGDFNTLANSAFYNYIISGHEKIKNIINQTKTFSGQQGDNFRRLSYYEVNKEYKTKCSDNYDECMNTIRDILYLHKNHDKIEINSNHEEVYTPFRLKSVYHTHERSSEDRESKYVTSYINYNKSLVDYIYYSNGLDIKFASKDPSINPINHEEVKLVPIKCLEPLRRNYPYNLPNKNFPSDHCSLVTIFNLYKLRVNNKSNTNKL
ncbi:DNase I-like protein [Neocallimastix lanati (nom. inval.)]|jgi:protein angel|uniref:DNase I-like protein n=1 Tax=Neocallimastix californiae TaxID=1754190 RepID=A0A1Y2AKA4_9FUNG|nr:DNase I-like protein [Neocallimastix sp. JGI-2020a]ORY22730.1 DNase I-like protein [Neocallimastix californiae]|eukprot:ORY22730.1 DNase I-like protein [Neocallimastix californiae]